MKALLPLGFRVSERDIYRLKVCILKSVSSLRVLQVLLWLLDVVVVVVVLRHCRDVMTSTSALPHPTTPPHPTPPLPLFAND